MIQYGAAPFTSEKIVNDVIRVMKEKMSAVTTTPCYQLLGSNDEGKVSFLQQARSMRHVWRWKSSEVRHILIHLHIQNRISRKSCRCSSHITFNSMAQFERFYPMTVAKGGGISCGIRVNPEYSEVETELYNPCAPGTRFGITADLLPDTLPQGIEGFHCHCHCESSSFELERTLEHLEEKFSRWFPQLKWLNLGGGHLMTRKDYDTEYH